MVHIKKHQRNLVTPSDFQNYEHEYHKTRVANRIRKDFSSTDHFKAVYISLDGNLQVVIDGDYIREREDDPRMLLSHYSQDFADDLNLKKHNFIGQGIRTTANNDIQLTWKLQGNLAGDV